MKKCPECNKQYFDDTLNYCLDDGSRLVDCLATQEPATAILSEPGAVATGFQRDEISSELPTANLQQTATPGGTDPSLKRRKWLPIAAVSLLLVIGGVGFAVYKFWGSSDKPLQAMKMERLTTNGKSTAAAISPDGKYVVYSVDEGGQHSLWVRQVTASSNVQIIPPAEDVYYWGLTFTPDSNYINFVKVQFEKNVAWSLYQMPVLGGTQKKLITQAEGGISYSPDGKQFAFVREEFRARKKARY